MSTYNVTSKQLMSVLSDAQERIATLENMAAVIKLNLDSRLSAVRNIQEYEQQQMTELTSLVESGVWTERKNKIVCGRTDIIQGVYDKFGSTIHPQFLKVPSNVFNFKTTNGYAYKDNAIITVNEVIKPKYTAMLMHDSVNGQDIYFEEYDTPTIEISIKVNPGELLGTTAFNLLEIVPFIPGSFDIISLEVYSLQGHYLGDVLADSKIPGPIRKVGVSRILIDRTVNLYELKMTVSINFRNSNGRYPFGIKHLYFLNAAFDPNSYAVFKVKENKYIDTVSEDVTVTDQTGVVNSTCKEERMELYINWVDGVGVDSIVTSKGLTNNPIIRDTDSFYVYYPIVRSVMSFQFDKITLR